MTRARPLLSILVIAASAGLLYAMRNTTPGYQELTGPIPETGTMRETITTRLFDVTVERVIFAHALTFEGLGRQHTRTTSGLWAVVTTQLSATRKSSSVGYAAWVGPTGLLYQQTGRLEHARGVPPYPVDPGLSREGRFVFEIRADQARNATLVVSNDFSPRLDSEARIILDRVPETQDGRLAVLDVLDLDHPQGVPN